MNPNNLSANQSQNINTNGTTIIPGKCILIGILIGTKGASSNVATIYDSNSTIGANVTYKKATIDTVNTFGYIPIGIPCFNGIYIVTATGTPADMTVIYSTFGA